MVTALIADVRDSRGIADRAGFQRHLIDLVQELDRELQPGGVGKAELTSGDEIQGLFHRPREVVPALVRIADAIHPTEIVFGIGYGALTTDPSPRVSLMDGPCLHNARAGLEEAQRRGVWGVVQGFSDTEDALLTSAFELMGIIRSGWKTRQALYVRSTRTASTQAEVAEEFNVYPSVVSESLQAAHFKEVVRAEEAIAVALDAFGPRAES